MSLTNTAPWTMHRKPAGRHSCGPGVQPPAQAKSRQRGGEAAAPHGARRQGARLPQRESVAWSYVGACLAGQQILICLLTTYTAALNKNCPISLQATLPLNFSSSVFVRVDENQLALWRVIITGPADTPCAPLPRVAPAAYFWTAVTLLQPRAAERLLPASLTILHLRHRVISLATCEASTEG